jgi:hypothetical protein
MNMGACGQLDRGRGLGKESILIKTFLASLTKQLNIPCLAQSCYWIERGGVLIPSLEKSRVGNIVALEGGSWQLPL